MTAAQQTARLAKIAKLINALQEEACLIIEDMGAVAGKEFVNGAGIESCGYNGFTLTLDTCSVAIGTDGSVTKHAA